MRESDASQAVPGQVSAPAGAAGGGVVASSDRLTRLTRRVSGRVVVAYFIACLAPLVGAAVFFHARHAAGVANGFPLDDSWIHAQYARTIVEGRPFEYTAGQRSMGTTSALFDVVWAAAMTVTGEPVLTVQVMNTLLNMAAAALLVALLLRLETPPLTAGVGAAIIMAHAPFAWSSLSGMETALATFLTVAAVLAHARDMSAPARGWRAVFTPVLMALVALARPENLVLYPLSELDRAIRYRLSRRVRGSRSNDGSDVGCESVSRRPLACAQGSDGFPRLRFGLNGFPRLYLGFRGDVSFRARGVAMRGLAFGLVLAPSFVLNWSIHGGIFPHTFAAKVGSASLIADLQSNGMAALAGRAKHACLLLPQALSWMLGTEDRITRLTIVLGCVALLFRYVRRVPACRTLLPLILFPAGILAIGVMTGGVWLPGQGLRYLVQWFPMLLLPVVVGMDLLARLAGRWLPARAGIVYALILGAFAFNSTTQALVRYSMWTSFYVTSVKNINEMQVTLGRWVNEHTPPNAVIATNDIGAITYFGHRPVVDTMGLIDPEMLRRRRSPDPTVAVIAYFRQRGVTHVLLFPSWHPDLIRRSEFRELRRLELEDNVICGDACMMVLEMKPPEEESQVSRGAHENGYR